MRPDHDVLSAREAELVQHRAAARQLAARLRRRYMNAVVAVDCDGLWGES